MNTNNYEYMLAIAREGTILKAAEKLNISQSALSQALAKEEKEAGGQLFERTRGKKVTVTPLGELYLRTAETMIRIKNETYEGIERLAHDTSRTIRIAICNQAYNSISDRILTVLKDRFPDINIYFYRSDSSQSLQLLKNGNVDLAILAARQIRDSVIETSLLYHEHLVLAVSQGYPLDHDAPLIRQLRAIPFIYYAKDTFLEPLIPEEMSIDRLKPPAVYKSPSAEETLRLVENGYGAGLVPSHLIKAEHGFTVIETDPPVCYDIMIAIPKYSRNKENLYDIFRMIKELKC
ncbi:MAG: LysR family transcriptional regulator [Solobacterium sp.]|nr:LysR family transcriptional regulator [Solobacterium sp.]